MTNSAEICGWSELAILRLSQYSKILQNQKSCVHSEVNKNCVKQFAIAFWYFYSKCECSANSLTRQNNADADSALALGDNMVETALMLFIVICPCNACPCYILSTVALHLELKFVNSAEQPQD